MLAIIENLSNGQSISKFLGNIKGLKLNILVDNIFNYLHGKNQNMKETTLEVRKVGFQVQSINEEASRTLPLEEVPSQEVEFSYEKGGKTREEVFPRPQEPRRGEDPTRTKKSLGLDLGANLLEELLRQAWTPIVPRGQFQPCKEAGAEQGQNFDNRLACVRLIEILRSLKIKPSRGTILS